MMKKPIIFLHVWAAALLGALPRGGYAKRMDDEMYHKILEEAELEELQLNSKARRLEGGLEADGFLGSKCGFFNRNKCNSGLECFHNRCIPNRECLRERLQEFDASFDSQAYKQTMFQQTGVTNDDLLRALQDSRGDEAVFVESNTMQSLIHYMQRNMEPFEPVADIVHSCASNSSSTSAQVPPERRLKLMNGPPPNSKKLKRRHLQTSPSTSADTPSVSVQPSSAPSTTSAPSFSSAPSKQPSAAPTRRPTSPHPTPVPTPLPTSSPTIPRTSTTFVGIHLEAGFGLELSLTAAWSTAIATPPTLIRGCFGGEFGGGLELSFYLATVFDGLDNGWNCASTLLDTDVGLGINLGMGLGNCFAGSASSYLEFTLGAGLGIGIGFNVCGVQTVPTCSQGDVIFSRLEYGFFDSTTPRAPTTDEIRGLMTQTERFYTDVFTKAYPNTFLSFQMANVHPIFLEGNVLPVILDFDSKVEFRTSRRVAEDEEAEWEEDNLPRPFPSTKEIIATMNHADYHLYISDYVYAAEPTDGLFSGTNSVEFTGSGSHLPPVDDSHDTSPSYSKEDDDYYYSPSKSKDDYDDDYDDDDDDDDNSKDWWSPPWFKFSRRRAEPPKVAPVLPPAVEP